MFTSRRISGERAGDIGLIDRVCPEDRLDEVVEELAREITENSWGTNRIDKALLRAHGDRSRTDALVIERGAPYGFPKDRAERMSRRPSKKKSD
jgi:enoyl-CoA hydratase/carnithine racemase